MGETRGRWESNAQPCPLWPVTLPNELSRLSCMHQLPRHHCHVYRFCQEVLLSLQSLFSHVNCFAPSECHCFACIPTVMTLVCQFSSSNCLASCGTNAWFSFAHPAVHFIQVITPRIIFQLPQFPLCHCVTALIQLGSLLQNLFIRIQFPSLLILQRCWPCLCYRGA